MCAGAELAHFMLVNAAFYLFISSAQETQRGTIRAFPSQLSAKLTEGQPLSTFIIFPGLIPEPGRHTGNKPGTKSVQARKSIQIIHTDYEHDGSKTSSRS